MAGNTTGTVFRVTTFGESHGLAIGGVVDGCPAGISFDTGVIRYELGRRKANSELHSTTRHEMDEPRILSGIFEGKTTGAPIAFMIVNKAHDPGAYHQLRDAYRASHGDYGWHMKYGHFDHRGGGRYSARETAARVVAGAIARQLLAHYGITVQGWVSGIGNIQLDGYGPYTSAEVEASTLRCPDSDVAKAMMSELEAAFIEKDTLGGLVSCVVNGVPAGLGEPVFDKVESELAKAMMSIPAVKGFEMGSGFKASTMRGTAHNDPFNTDEQGAVVTTTNHAGGTLGGIASGNPVCFRVAFKPVSSVKRKEETITHDKKKRVIDLTGGRHDVCVVPRAVPVVEAMAAIVFADLILRNRSARIKQNL